MFFREDSTYNDIRRKSLEQWLGEIENHEDIAVRGGVKLCREYLEYLNDKIEKLKGYGKLAIIFLVIFAVLIAVTRLIIWALPTIFTFAVIVWIFKKLNGR